MKSENNWPYSVWKCHDYDKVWSVTMLVFLIQFVMPAASHYKKNTHTQTIQLLRLKSHRLGAKITFKHPKRIRLAAISILTSWLTLLNNFYGNYRQLLVTVKRNYSRIFPQVAIRRKTSLEGYENNPPV